MPNESRYLRSLLSQLIRLQFLLPQQLTLQQRTPLLNLIGRPIWLHLNQTPRAGLRLPAILLRQTLDLLRPPLGLEIRRAGLKTFPLNKHLLPQNRSQFRRLPLLEMDSMKSITVIVDATAHKANIVVEVIAAIEAAVVVKAVTEAIVMEMAGTEVTVGKAAIKVIVVEMVAIQVERLVTKAIVEEMVAIEAIVAKAVDIAPVEITGVNVVIGEEVKAIVVGAGAEEEAIEEAIVGAAANLDHKTINSANLLPPPFLVGRLYIKQHLAIFPNRLLQTQAGSLHPTYIPKPKTTEYFSKK